jgi:Cdc6-like AAA superfamily ATPase
MTVQLMNVFHEPKVKLIDTDLDVKERLAELKLCHNNVLAMDQEYEKRLLQLEDERRSVVNKTGARMIDQKQNMIGIARRRLRILKVGIPLVSSPQVIDTTGYANLYKHFSAQYAELTTGEKLLWLENLSFIMTTDVMRTNEKLLHMLRRTEEGEQRNLLIGGSSGSGKTNFMNWFALQYAATVEPERNRIPVILVEAIKDDKTTKSLLQQTVLACGNNYVDDDTVHHLFNMIGSLFQICGVRLLMIDELNHLTDATQRRRVLEISNRTFSTSIVGAAVNPLEFRSGSPEIQGRFNDYVCFEPYKGKRLLQLLSVLEILLPFTTPSYLAARELEQTEGRKNRTVPGPAAFIERKTKGSFRYIMSLIRDAAELAIKRDYSNITYELLEETWASIQTSDPDEISRSEEL